MISKISLISMLCLVSSLGADLLETLPFPVRAHGLYRPSGRFFIAASTRFAKNERAIAIADRTSSEFYGITPERIILNSRADQVNPLNGAAIEHLALLDKRPVVIPDAIPVSLFLIEYTNRSVKQSDRDAKGADVPGGKAKHSGSHRDSKGAVVEAIQAKNAASLCDAKDAAVPDVKAKQSASHRDAKDAAVLDVKVRQSAPLRDAKGNLVPFVLALTTTADQQVVSLDAGADLAAIAAVPNAEGGFDGNGSGIAFAQYKQVINPKANLKFFTWDILDALTGASSFTHEGVATDEVFAVRPTNREKRGTAPLAWLGKKSNVIRVPDPSLQKKGTKQVPVAPHEGPHLAAYIGKKSHSVGETTVPSPQRRGNKAAPFGKDTPELMIGVPAAAIASAVDLHYDRELGRLYIATQVTAGAGDQAGARAIVVASTANGHLQFQKLAPDSAFDTDNRIIGKKGPGSITNIYKVRTMQTRTYLRYLIVVGGNGDDPALEQSVFALPLVDKMIRITDNDKKVLFVSSLDNGTLARVDADPVTNFGDVPPHRFEGRMYATPAQQPSDLYTMSSPQARVGGQATLPGPISEIEVSAEAVFVSCTSSDSLNQEQLAEGIFYSQPVFDTEGRIGGWTDWHRVAHSSAPVTGFGYDPSGIFWQIRQSSATTTEIYRSKWTDGTDELSKFVMRFVNKEKGGIQGLFDLPYTTYGFSTDVNERLSVQVLTSYKKVILLQTGKTQNGLFSSFEDFHDVFVRTDGMLRGFEKASSLVLSGGVLDTLGPISSAAVLSDGVTGWFVVGGAGGIAILADAQGLGWDAQQGLQSGFKGLSPLAEWKLVSTTPFVRKLLVQDGQLFALSQGKLERFALSAEALVQGSVSSVVLSELSPDQKKSLASYSDFSLKGPLAIIATSFGLIRSGNGTDVRTATALPWLAVPLPESVGSLTNPGPVSRLYAIQTSDGDALDNLYVLNGYVGLNQALIYRLVVSLENGIVTDSSVLLFPDYILKDTQTFFTNIGEYRDYVVTDGAFIALSRSSLDCSPPLLELLSPALKSGQSARSRAPFIAMPGKGTIGLLVRSSSSGAWMVPGDFGVRIQR